ncbi:MAG: cytidine deaminase [Candidatus Eremiobacteraeota bacterium]|nr:cytidine deaminase [Candidatus Eremiobacteraeota bacterium]
MQFSTEELLNAAHTVRARAYAPYSGFAVGAAVDVGDGILFSGANVENASYGLSLCAERAAIVAAVSAGYRAIVAIAVAGPANTTTAPCGACRQFILEFGPEAAVTFTTPTGAKTVPIEGLLPESFGPKNLPK